jgi:flagellar motor switch/type III secretory pathway protein FliN
MSSSPTSSSSSGPHEPAAAPFAALADLACPVEVVLGHGNISVGTCLTLRPQSVIRLTASAGEDLHVVVGGVPVMRGEVVLVDQSAAIRITEFTPAPGMES